MKALTSAAAAVLLSVSLPVLAQETPATGENADSPAEQAPIAQAVPEAEAAGAASVDGFLAEQMPGELLSSDLVGQLLFDEAGGELGQITDVLIDTEHRLAGVVLALPEAMAGGDAAGEVKHVGIPFASLQQVTGEDNEIRLVASIDQAALETAPVFEPLRREAAMDDNQDLVEPGTEAKGGSTPPTQ